VCVCVCVYVYRPARHQEDIHVLGQRVLAEHQILCIYVCVCMCVLCVYICACMCGGGGGREWGVTGRVAGYSSKRSVRWAWWAWWVGKAAIIKMT
jgi:hypothetical protein